MKSVNEMVWKLSVCLTVVLSLVACRAESQTASAAQATAQATAPAPAQPKIVETPMPQMLTISTETEKATEPRIVKRTKVEGGKEIVVEGVQGMAEAGQHIPPVRGYSMAKVDAERKAIEIAAGLEVTSSETLIGANETELYTEHFNSRSQGTIKKRENENRRMDVIQEQLRYTYELTATVFVPDNPVTPEYRLDFEVLNSDGAPTNIFSPGSNIFFRFRASRPVYITLVALNSDESLDIIYPNDRETPRVTKETVNEWQTYPDPAIQNFPLSLSENENEETIILFAVATEQKFDRPSFAVNEAYATGTGHAKVENGIDGFTAWYLDAIPDKQQVIEIQSFRIQR